MKEGLIQCPNCPAYLMLWYHKCGDCGNDFDKMEEENERAQMIIELQDQFINKLFTEIAQEKQK